MLVNTCDSHGDVLSRTVGAVGVDVLYSVYNVQSFLYLSEHGVLAIEERSAAYSRVSLHLLCAEANGILLAYLLRLLHKALLHILQSGAVVEHRTEVLRAEWVSYTPELFSRLKLERGDRCYHLVRMRYVSGKPFVLVENYVPESVFPGIDAYDFARRSLYDVFETVYHERIIKSRRVLMVQTANAEFANLFGVHRGSPVLYVENTVIYARVEADGTVKLRVDKFYTQEVLQQMKEAFGAKPGDLIFFQGTYNTSGASHVGIYVGNGMMIHCGDPISYANINTSYWQQHFYCYGRLP